MLDGLLSSVQATLNAQLVGIYLYGSLATGDFAPDSSDIDFLVVTAAPLSGETIAALEEMHRRLFNSPIAWAAKLEGSYLPQQDLPRYDAAGGPYPSINEGRFYLARHGSDWIIQRHVLREFGVVVYGPPLRDRIDPVHADDLCRAVNGFLHGWWAPMLDNPIRLRNAEYQAYAILTMCRALHTLREGTIASKPVAARWAQDTLGERWSGAIEDALAWPDKTSPDMMQAALGLIRYTLECEPDCS